MDTNQKMDLMLCREGFRSVSRYRERATARKRRLRKGQIEGPEILPRRSDPTLCVGIDLVTLAAFLGHSKIQMVLRYAHPSQEHQARSVERMERFVAERQMEALSKKDGTETGMIQ